MLLRLQKWYGKHEKAHLLITAVSLWLQLPHIILVDDLWAGSEFLRTTPEWFGWFIVSIDWLEIPTIINFTVFLFHRFRMK